MPFCDNVKNASNSGWAVMSAMKERKVLRFWDGDAGLALLLFILALVTCVSLTTVIGNSLPRHPNFWPAVATTLVFIGFIPLFVRAPFGFGFVAGISFYSMIVGFFWYTYFTGQTYDYVLARWSAASSLLLFLLPVLFQTKSLPRALSLSPQTFDRLVPFLLVIACLMFAWGSYYGFALVGLSDSEELRGTFARPAVLNYLLGAVTGAVLPFAFAYLAWQRRYLLAAVAILLIWASYPVLLNKSVVFGGLWLPFLFILFSRFDPKRATIFSLLIPILPGMIAYELLKFGLVSWDGAIGRAVRFVFGNVNIRLFAYPTFAMNQYSDFFASHPLTHFCQIGFVRALYGCPYPFQLGAAMSEAYHMGNLNGSLFATEGIASVGPLWAPLSALVCGCVVSLGNSASARLPAPVIATSAGFAVQQALLNVPLSATLLTNGLLVLWLLWAIAPRTPECGD